MVVTNPAFEPNEQSVRHHNSLLASEEYIALEAALRSVMVGSAVGGHEGSALQCDVCKSYREAAELLRSTANKPWTWTGTRGPVE